VGRGVPQGDAGVDGEGTAEAGTAEEQLEDGEGTLNSTMPPNTDASELARTIEQSNQQQPNVALPNLAREYHNQKHYVRPSPDPLMPFTPPFRPVQSVQLHKSDTLNPTMQLTTPQLHQPHRLHPTGFTGLSTGQGLR